MTAPVTMLEATDDRMLDADESIVFANGADARKVALARGAWPALHSRALLDDARSDGRTPLAEPSTWREALATLDAYADALASWDEARAIADALDLLAPHLLLAQVQVAVAEAERPALSLADFLGWG